MSIATNAIQSMIDSLQVGGEATQLVRAAFEDALRAVQEAEADLEPRFPISAKFTVGERIVLPGTNGSYPDHSRDQWGNVTEIRREVVTEVKERLIIQLDGHEPRAINSDVVAHGNDWRFAPSARPRPAGFLWDPEEPEPGVPC